MSRYGPSGVPRRAVLGAVASVVALGSLSGCGSGSTGLDGALLELVGGLDPGGPYRPPTQDESRRAELAADLLLDDSPRASAMFAPLGISVRTVTDTVTDRRYGMVSSEQRTERSWGLLIVDLDGRSENLLIEVPHPGSDQHTELIGLDLLRAVPGSVLMVAGAHRRAAEARADVAHQTDSLFHTLAVRLADRGFAQLQLHGFHDGGLPSQDIVISAGAGEPNSRTERASDRLATAGFVVCRAWRRNCGSLEGRRNVQGRVAAERARPFTHLEMSRTVRDDVDHRARIVDVLAESYRT